MVERFDIPQAEVDTFSDEFARILSRPVALTISERLSFPDEFGVLDVALTSDELASLDPSAD